MNFKILVLSLLTLPTICIARTIQFSTIADDCRSGAGGGIQVQISFFNHSSATQTVTLAGEMSYPKVGGGWQVDRINPPAFSVPTGGTTTAANFYVNNTVAQNNCPGQVVVSGTLDITSTNNKGFLSASGNLLTRDGGGNFVDHSFLINAGRPF